MTNPEFILARQKLGLTQVALAKKMKDELGFGSRRQVQNYEGGEDPIPLYLSKWLEALVEEKETGKLTNPICLGNIFIHRISCEDALQIAQYAKKIAKLIRRGDAFDEKGKLDDNRACWQQISDLQTDISNILNKR